MYTYPQSDHSLPHWKCVLKFYADCPCIYIPDQETTKKHEEQHHALTMSKHLIWHWLQCAHILSLIIHFHTGNFYCVDVPTFHVSILLTKKLCGCESCIYVKSTHL